MDLCFAPATGLAALIRRRTVSPLEATQAVLGQIARVNPTVNVLWSRVRDFLARYDLIATPTAAVQPFPVETWYPTAINGQPVSNYVAWLMLTYAFTGGRRLAHGASAYRWRSVNVRPRAGERRSGPAGPVPCA